MIEEWCDKCNSETEISQQGGNCKNCGAYLLSCSQCDWDIVMCGECKFSKNKN